MQVAVDENRCQGHGLCVLNAPRLFELDDDTGRAAVVAGEVDGELVLDAEAAVGNCPEGAISLTGDAVTA